MVIYAYCCLAFHAEPGLVMPRKRHRTINGIIVKSEFVKDERIISYCGDIIAAIGLPGNIGVQVKQSAAGGPLLLKINPRV
ncbi:MAG TPA: ATP-grasp domain-containing protein [Flavisolibacter sp.]|nr:ATP-grasp domain-containing protein [Flavisolibacter sp.]